MRNRSLATGSDHALDIRCWTFTNNKVQSRLATGTLNIDY